jgi:hypothetical protein
MVRVVLLTVALLVGCSQAAERDTRVDRSEARRTAAKALAAQPPVRQVYRFDNGELVVMDIATVTERGLADSQKCFLWRDQELKSASLQCPADTPGNLPTFSPSVDSGPNY